MRCVRPRKETVLKGRLSLNTQAHSNFRQPWSPSQPHPGEELEDNRDNPKESEDTRWQAPQKSRRLQRLPDPLAWPFRKGSRLAQGGYGKRFSLLARVPQATLPTSKNPHCLQDKEEAPLYKPKLCVSQRLTAPGAPSRTDAAISSLEKFRLKLPHTYWILGALQTCWVGITLTFFGNQKWASLEPYKGVSEKLTDRKCISFYGIITWPGRVRDQVIYQTFVVSQLKKNAILGMPFPEKHKCPINF